MKLRRPLFACVLALILFLTDFFFKLWASTTFPLMNAISQYPYGGIGVFENFYGIQFSIVHQINRGMAWGLFADWQLVLLGLRIALVIALILYLIFWNCHTSWEIPLVLVITGAIANIVDYFFYGHVIDLFYSVFWGYDYPVFNLADSFIFFGIFWLFFNMIEWTKGEVEG